MGMLDIDLSEILVKVNAQPQLPSGFAACPYTDKFHYQQKISGRKTLPLTHVLHCSCFQSLKVGVKSICVLFTIRFKIRADL